MTDQLIETIEGGIATLTMNRPQARNALTFAMYERMAAICETVNADRSIKAMILTGTGDKAFASGTDISQFRAFKTAEETSGGGFNIERRVQGLREAMDVCRWLHEMPKPTLAVIGGAAAGAGLSLALACDLRIAADDAKLTTAFSKVGLAGDYGGSYFLSHLVGAAKARELYFTGDVINGAEALRLGVVNKSVPREELDDFAADFARHLAGLPTVAIGYMKRNLNAAEHATLSEVLDLEAMNMIRTMMTDDHKAASLSFVAKEKPTFHGR